MKLFASLILLLSFFSCDKKTNSPISEDSTLKEVALLPEISGIEVKQNNFKTVSMELILENTPNITNTSYALEYFNDGKIKKIKNIPEDSFDFDYQNQSLIIRKNNFEAILQLNDKGLAETKNQDFTETKFYFKNDFLVRKKNNFTIEKFDYSSNGNLLSYEGPKYTANFSYSNIPNTIRQEILEPTAFHWTFRDKYLGNYSSHLIKNALFNKGKYDEVFLDFSYKFDDNNKVIEMIINRKTAQGSGQIVYNYTY
jgi:hypothetical protein